MNVKSSATVLVILLWTSSVALTADKPPAPGNGLYFPDSVERAMMGQATAKSRLRTNEFRPYSEREGGGTVKKPIDLFLEKSNPPAPEPIRVRPEEPFVPFTPAAAPDPKDYPEMEKAFQLLREGKVANAVNELRETLPKDHKLPSEYVLIYHLLARAGQPNEASSWLEHALVQLPNDPEPWTILGRIAMQKNRNGEAELDFGKAKQLLAGPPDTDHKKLVERDALNGMAQVAERREQWPEAEARLEEYLKCSPEDIDALQRLARATFCSVKSGKNAKAAFTAAYKTLQRAKEIDKRNAEKNHTPEMLLPAAALLAQLFDKYERGLSNAIENSHNAKNMYLFALRQAPDDLKLRAAVGEWALKNDENVLAQEQADAALKIEVKDNALPEKERKYRGSTVGHMLAGEVALWQKQWSNAENHIQAVCVADINKFEARDKLALALVEQNVPAKQAKGLELAYGNYQNNKDNKNNIEAAATLSWVYFRIGKFDLAGAAMDAVLRATNVNSFNPDTATYLAYILDHNDNGHNGLKYKAKKIIEQLLNSGRPFRMWPEAVQLSKKLEDVKAP